MTRKQTNAEALERTLVAMKASDAITEEHAALVAAAQHLADVVDTDPGNASLWKEYRAALASLMEVAGGGIDDEAAAFLRSVSVQPTMGNQAKP